jgi:hypothetical protein
VSVGVSFLIIAFIQRVYSDTFKVFYDPYGGDRFGAVWDPSVKQPRPFRVLGGFSSAPLNKDKVCGPLNFGERDAESGFLLEK